MRRKLFIRLVERVTLSRSIAAERKSYRLHPTHTQNSAGTSLQELSQGIAGMDRHYLGPDGDMPRTQGGT